MVDASRRAAATVEAGSAAAFLFRLWLAWCPTREKGSAV
jgi:hypothetical protein